VHFLIDVFEMQVYTTLEIKAL